MKASASVGKVESGRQSHFQEANRRFSPMIVLFRAAT
jgi:hypothetical protein